LPRAERPASFDPKRTDVGLIEHHSDFTSEGGALHGAIRGVMYSTGMLENTRRRLEVARGAGLRSERRGGCRCQAAQLPVPPLSLLERLADERRRSPSSIPSVWLSELQRHDGVHQPLCAVVQIAHHTARGLVGLGDQGRPRSAELVAASVFAMAVSRSWVNWAIRSSVSARGDCSPLRVAIATPQRRPTIGVPTLACTPAVRPSSAMVPGVLRDAPSAQSARALHRSTVFVIGAATVSELAVRHLVRQRA
jgi:hypothetical protein